MGRRLETSHRRQPSRVADQEARLAQPAVPSLRRGDQPGRGIHHRHSRAGVSQVRRQHALPAADVEDRLARLRLEEVQHGGDGELAVVRGAAVADPAVVPGRDALPARLARRPCRAEGAGSLAADGAEERDGIRAEGLDRVAALLEATTGIASDAIAEPMRA